MASGGDGVLLGRGYARAGPSPMILLLSLHPVLKSTPMSSNTMRPVWGAISSRRKRRPELAEMGDPELAQMQA